FFILFAAHLMIDQRSSEVFREELHAHAKNTNLLIHERISSSIRTDLQAVSTFAYQAALLSGRSNAMLSSFAISYQQRSPHVVAIGVLGDQLFQYKLPETISHSSEDIARAIADSEDRLTLHGNSDGYNGS